jgi:hypothetical protein
MPGIYKEKECPVCTATHRRRGPYCSQSCANSTRITSDDTKDKLREKAYEYLQTPEGIANAKQLNNPHRVTVDEFAVEVPDVNRYDSLDDYSEWARSEDW